MNVNIDRAMATSDYDCEERRAELAWLAEQASRRSYICEVGSYKGTTARAMAENTAGRVVCVDTFRGTPGEDGMAKLLAEHEEGWLLKEFLRNTEGLPNLSYLEMDSVEAAAMLKRQAATFDMIFIDASHDEESFTRDVNAWLPVLAPGGLLCGHDRQWDGVAAGLNKLIPNHQVGVGAIWYRP